MAQDCDQRLTVNGIIIGETITDTPRWQIQSFADILHREIRGDDRQVPYLAGRVPYPRRLDRTRMQFPMIIHGDYDAAGSPVAEAGWAQQRVTNVEALLTAWEPGAAGMSATDGTCTATWRRPDGSTKSATVHILLPLALGDPGNTRFYRTVLELSVPTGKFT